MPSVGGRVVNVPIGSIFSWNIKDLGDRQVLNRSIQTNIYSICIEKICTVMIYLR